MLQGEETRNKTLQAANNIIREAAKSTDPWLRTVLVWRERALDSVAVPWLLCTLNAVLWQVLHVTVGLSEQSAFIDDRASWQDVHSVVFSTTLAFLLVFRLNRVALRWWETRRMWGVIVEQIRLLVAGVLEHLQRDASKHKLRDQAIAWSCAFTIASKQLLRRDTAIDADELVGILSIKEIMRLEQARHPPLYAAGELRHAICSALAVDDNTPISVATSHVAARQMLEANVAALVQNVGGMERVSATPLPLVYVSHLRTFLLLYLLSLPYLYGPAWNYWTIPVVAVISFALLGIDGAAAECEVPFHKNRANHLDMEAYCVAVFANVTGLMMQAFDMQARAKEEAKKNDD
jgi:putative membrane protein